MKRPLNEIKRMRQKSCFTKQETEAMAKDNFLIEIENPLFGTDPDEPRFYGFIVPKQLYNTKK